MINTISSFISVTPSNLGGLPLKFFGQVGAGQLSFASEQTGSEIAAIRFFFKKKHIKHDFDINM
jgi:hypothetical protein